MCHHTQLLYSETSYHSEPVTDRPVLPGHESLTVSDSGLSTSSQTMGARGTVDVGQFGLQIKSRDEWPLSKSPFLKRFLS